MPPLEGRSIFLQHDFPSLPLAEGVHLSADVVVIEVGDPSQRVLVERDCTAVDAQHQELGGEFFATWQGAASVDLELNSDLELCDSFIFTTAARCLVCLGDSAVIPSQLSSLCLELRQKKEAWNNRQNEFKTSTRDPLWLWVEEQQFE